MAKLVPIIVALIPILLGCVHGEDIDCGLVPTITTVTQLSSDFSFGISTDKSEFTVGGGPIRVTLYNVETSPNLIKNFKVFALQAHDVLDNSHGRWEAVTEGPTTRKCNYGNQDTLYNGETMTHVASIEALWYPDFPDTVEIPNKDIDFNAVVILDDGTFWNVRSIVHKAMDVHSSSSETEQSAPDTDEETEAAVSEEPETEDTGEDPNAGEITDERERDQENHRDSMGGDHGLKEEELSSIKNREEKEKEIREEDDASEGGWVREEEEQRERDEEEQHQEMMAYEREKAEEERKREEMIRWEIHDKEEYERMMAEQSTAKPSKDDEDQDKNLINPDLDVNDSGASVPLIHLVFMCLPFLVLLV